MTDTVEGLRREAKRIHRATTITHSQALDVLAVQRGFSHWGALCERLEEERRLDAEWRDRIVTPHDMLAGVLPDAVDAIRGIAHARHLIVTGTTSTGKTTLIRRMIDRMPDRTRAASIDGYDDVVHPRAERLVDNRFGRSCSRADMDEAWTRIGDAGVVVVEEIRSDAAWLADRAAESRAPTLVSPIHASTIDQASRRFTALLGRDRMPEGFGCVLMTRSVEGARTIADVGMMR